MTYYDDNVPHPTTTTKEMSKYKASNDHFKSCYEAKTCAFKIDFNALKSEDNSGTAHQTTVLVEGTRFIKIRAQDIAGNYSEKIFGPYQFDITGPTAPGKLIASGEDGTFINE